MKVYNVQFTLLSLLGLYCNAFITPTTLLSLSNNSNIKGSKQQSFLHANNKNKSKLQSSRSRQLYASPSGTIDDAEADETELTEVKSKLTKEFFKIGLPAFVQLAAEPLASLVDTAYLGRLGPEVLGGAGVAISAQYAVSKLYNDPLLRTSISLVASQDGKARSKSKSISSSDQTKEDDEEKAKKELSVAVSSGLLLALTVGVVQLVVYSLLANGIIKGMG